VERGRERIEMPDFEYEIPVELSQFAELMPRMALEAAVPAMDRTVKQLQAALPFYPVALPDSRYRRTETLGKKDTWRTDVTKGDLAIVGAIGTNLDYAAWVVGPDKPGIEIGGRLRYQSGVHVDRWWQFDKTIDDNIEAAWDEFERAWWEEFKARLG
jgi:hypothetical protein